MPPFPERSPGVLLSPMGDRAIAYDLVTETAHQLNASAGELLASCDGTGDIDDAATAWAKGAGIDQEIVAADVTAGLAMLEGLGLIGRDQPVEAPKRVAGSTADPEGDDQLGKVHSVIDYKIAFRGPQPELITTLDRFLGTGTETGDPTMFFDVHITDDGEVVLVTDYEWKFPSLEACLRQLTSVVNEYAVWTHSCAALHAGAVRSPEGEIVLLPAPSGNGKSTLTGAFVAAGWDYLGDEATGVRPGSLEGVGYPKRLAIGSDSRVALNLPESDSGDLDPAEINPGVNRLDGDVGPVNRVVLPTYLLAPEIVVRYVVQCVGGGSIRVRESDTR